jgi:hypothetical protein
MDAIERAANRYVQQGDAQIENKLHGSPIYPQRLFFFRATGFS